MTHLWRTNEGVSRRQHQQELTPAASSKMKMEMKLHFHECKMKTKSVIFVKIVSL